MSDIDKILDEIDEVIDKASPFPLTAHKLIIDGDRLKDLIYDMRENLPQEIQKANIIVHDCERLKKEAEVKAEDIIRQAEDRARNLVSENEITKQAKQKAYEMLMQAQNKSKDVKNAANIYVENLLSDTEAYFHQNLQEVKRTRQQILNVKK
jgi:vacuolar-type H+-ATPase subunit H